MKKPLGVAVFLVVILLVAQFVYLRARPQGEKGILGGPVITQLPSQEISLMTPAAITSPLLVIPEAQGETIPPASQEDGFWAASLIDSGAVANASNVVAGLVTYKIEKGDTLSSIAKSFGVSLNTVVDANPGLRSGSLKVGAQIKVPTISGAIYEVQANDTLESIASVYGVTAQNIKEMNNLEDGALVEGATILIPGAKPKSKTVATGPSLPSFPGYFMEPTDGFNWGALHPHNAVDIANSCGTPVVASAEGLVVPDKTFGDGNDSWNGGYGRFVLIEHPNNTMTRYAHLEKTTVSIGQYVKQGEAIGLMGNTGNTHGPTGCHIHFEVIGAKNPFAK